VNSPCCQPVADLKLGPETVKEAGESIWRGSRALLRWVSPSRTLFPTRASVEVPAVSHRLELADVEVALVAAADFLGDYPDTQRPLGVAPISAVHIQREVAPGSNRPRFRRRERLCGQGRGRTADLPLFRRCI